MKTFLVTGKYCLGGACQPYARLSASISLSACCMQLLLLAVGLPVAVVKSRTS